MGFFSGNEWNTHGKRFTKIFILLEALWALYTVIILIILRARAGDPLTDVRAILTELILSVLAHLPTPLTLIFMLHKFEKDQELPFLRSWWLISSFVLEIVLTAGAWIDFASSENKNLLFSYTIISMVVTGIVFGGYLVAYIAQMMQSRSAASAGGAVALDEIEANKSQLSFNNGSANLRFPLPVNARIVHQPRKDI